MKFIITKKERVKRYLAIKRQTKRGNLTYNIKIDNTPDEYFALNRVLLNDVSKLDIVRNKGKIKSKVNIVGRSGPPFANEIYSRYIFHVVNYTNISFYSYSNEYRSDEMVYVMKILIKRF